MKKTNIAVLGDGGWGTTLAILLSRKGFSVSMWGAFSDYVEYLDKKRINSRFLPGVKIPGNIHITSRIKDALNNKDLVILAAPSQHTREVLSKLKKTGHSHNAIYLSVTKGIEIGTLKRISEIVHHELGNVKLAVLSGPTIAQEVAKGVPTSAVIASRDIQVRKLLQQIFMTDRFRIYTSDDVIGVELGGSLKNIIAIACGISDGLGFGTNTKAAILARGLAEISRLGHKMGARVNSFSGLSGLGDLVTTCISLQSRNRFVGESIGKGKTLKQVIAHMQMVAEGIPTTKSAVSLSKKYKIEMPITQQVYQVLYRNKSPLKAVNDLMTRKGKEEHL
ncbi:MAG: NAD(P)-dependent glycerol-3-phosphate dehydrogenase [Candidatus Omnitrophica bacterium]|nr:NAD(P)-dependent glycerol-3-phosphate dehydrogenase [Candidatus Omnitrophota bacterium]